jgi:Glycosyl hydrolase family 12
MVWHIFGISFVGRNGVMHWRTVSRFFIGLLGKYCFNHLFLCVVACAVLPLGQARANVLTGKYDSLDVLGGEYRINNNVWGANTSQQVTAYTDDTFFEVTQSSHNQTSVASYPFIQKGVHFGGANTVDSGFPVKVDDVTAAPFDWSVDTSTAGGTWNTSFESWFSTTGGTSPNGLELMIWIDYQGDFYPGGNFVTNVNIAGMDWRLSYSPNWGAWDYVAYQLLTPTSDVSLDLKDFMDDSQARGYLNPAWFLDNMEAGFEIMSDGEGLTTNSFTANVFTGLMGDYNDDGTVDAGDYTAWRDAMANDGTLSNDPTPNSVDESDFTYWRDHFGESSAGAGAGSLAGAAVPEPSSLCLALGAMVALVACRRSASI